MHDAHPHRFLFYSEELDAHSARIRLSGDEHHHLSHVLRMKDGTTVYVTNGRGIIARCHIEDIGRHTTQVTVTGFEQHRERAGAVMLALGCLRKEAFQHAVKQCAELGVTRVIPFSSEKSHVRAYAPGFVERLRRIALSSMKQSFRAILPEIESVIHFDDLVGRAGASDLVIVGDPDAEPLRTSPGERSLLIVVGPEGGFVPAERTGLESIGALFASVSRYRLRSETAAAAMITMALGESGRERDGRSD